MTEMAMLSIFTGVKIGLAQKGSMTWRTIQTASERKKEPTSVFPRMYQLADMAISTVSQVLANKSVIWTSEPEKLIHSSRGANEEHKKDLVKPLILLNNTNNWFL